MKTDVLRKVFTQPAQVTLDQAVEAFLAVELVRCSPKTKAHYRYILERFAGEIGDRPLGDVFEVDLLGWYASLDELGLSPFTFGSYVQLVKRLFAWLHQKGILAADLAAGLKLPRLPRGNRKGISDADAQSILDASRGNVRDFAILSFLAATACRRGGAAELRLDDVHPWGEGTLARRATVREKGHDPRTVMMTPEALDALRAWLRVRPAVDDDHVFLGRSPGREWGALSPEGIRAMINRYRDRLGLAGPVSPHQWRHRRSRQLIKSGMSLKAVAQLNGHSVAVCERYYSDLGEDDLQAEYDVHVR